MTGRIANMMLNRTVVISDRSTYLEEHFVDGQEIMLFNLEEITMLPELIKNVLEDKALQENICEKAYEKAERTDIWKVRTKQFLEILNKHYDTP